MFMLRGAGKVLLLCPGHPQEEGEEGEGEDEEGDRFPDSDSVEHGGEDTERYGAASRR
jgi:hypothetical protein